MTKVTQISMDQDGGLNRRRIHLREISGEADSPLETVGQDLRAARLRRGDDLATVSRNLKIRKDYLEALEEDRFESLPGRTYAVGFVRSYSDYLGLDSIQCVERFKTEIAGRDEPPRAASIQHDMDEGKLPQGWIVIAVVVLGLIAYGAYHLAISADSLLRPTVTSVPAPPAPIAHAPPKALAQKAPPVSIPVPSVPLSQAPLTTEETPATPGANGAAANPGAAPPQPAQTPAQILAALPKGQVFGEYNANPRVVLRARAETKVLVQDESGKVFINRTLQPGDSYQVPDLVGLTLSTPNGGAVGVELDGQPMGFAGKDGTMTEAMSLNPQAVFDHFNGSPD
jgi:cytoskeleton protein RodZ